MLKWLGGIVLMLLMLCRPEDAANGAREGLRQWYYAVAPSLFPFMALLPLLTSPEANGMYDKLLGGLMRRLFNLPGSAAAPVAVGMLSGSPAGCAAAKRVAVSERWTRGQLERVAMACCGMSPAFCITAVGAGMLGDAGLGHILLRSQVLTQLTMLALGERFCRDGDIIEVSPEDVPSTPVLSIISVAGYMALFGAVAGAARMPWAQLALEVTAGARLICDRDLALPVKMAALSALAGYGGACVCAQNVGILRECGVNPVKFVACRCLAGAIAASYTLLFQAKVPASQPRTLTVSCIFALFLALPAIFRLKRTIS